MVKTMDLSEMCLAKLRYFLDCVKGSATPIVDDEDSWRVLQIAPAVRQSSIQRRVVAV